MTRNDYRLIAHTIARTIAKERDSHHAEILGMETVAIELGLEFERTYLNFDRARFFEVCGVEYRK